MSGHQVSQCQECSVSTHVTCSHELPPDCGLLDKQVESTTPFLNNCSKRCEIESWITIWE